MKLEKNGFSIELENEEHIAAYKCEGWAEVQEQKKKAPTTKPKSNSK